MSKTTEIECYLEELFPNATCELHYGSIFQLLIAVMLSAQTTDISVNKVTPALFERFPTPETLSMASNEEIEQLIKAIGLYKFKAKRAIEASKKIMEHFSGQVPSTMEELLTLDGVGRKTASVVLAEGFKIPAVPVDTHVERVSKRLGLAKISDGPVEIEQIIKKLFEQKNWIKLHHQLIFFGRYQCKAKNPICESCKLRNYCNKDF